MFTHPTIIETLPNGTKTASDLASKLLEERILVLNQPIDAASAMALTAALIVLEQRDPVAPIRLFINSPGGDVNAALGLISTMRDISCPVYAYCHGIAASAAALVLACADRRFAYEHSFVLIHQVMTCASAGATQQSDIHIIAEHTARLRDRLDDILAEATGRSKEEITRDTERDNYMSAEEAKAYGLVDEVIPFSLRSKGPAGPANAS